MEEENKALYLKGYKDGFYACMKMAWALANDLLVSVDINNKQKVRDYIDKLTH